MHFFRFYAIAAMLTFGWSEADAGQQTRLAIAVYDSAHSICAGAHVQLRRDARVVAETDTDGQGQATVALAGLGDFQVVAALPGFEPGRTDVRITEAGDKSVEVILTQVAAHKDSVDVNGSVSPLEQGSAAPQSVSVEAAKQMPSRPATVADALPLVPGVVRTPGGGLQISGSGEHRSSLLVNSADVTDPATGRFGLTVPIDSVERLEVYQTAYLAEYGRFSGGLVSVETRRGGDHWKWDLKDPLPDFRIRSAHLDGVKDATPRLNFEGPLIADKLFLSEGFEYVMRDTEAFTLPYPQNQSRQEGYNSFSQLDWLASANQLVTATFQVAPQRQRYVNINYFNPEQVSPDYGTHDYVATIGDRLSLLGGLLETTLSGSRFQASVWPQGTLDQTIAPRGNYGNYFEQQARDGSRLGLSSTYSLVPLHALGKHEAKIGTYMAGSSDTGQVEMRPVSIVDGAGTMLERISFSGGHPYQVSDREFAFFGQDHWTISRHVAVDLGLRTESQVISESFRVAPRMGWAWSPFSSAGPIIRGGLGAFYDRVPLNVYAFPSYPNQVVSTFDSSGVPVGLPVAYSNTLGQVTRTTALIKQEPGAGNFSPRTITWSMQLEQAVGHNLKLRAGYMANRSSGLVILDRIAPAEDATTGVDLLSGAGTSRYRQFELTAKVHLPGSMPLLFSYVKSQVSGDLNEFAGYLGSFPNPILRPNQYSTLPTDLPNRFLTWGNIKLPHGFWISPVVEYRNGFPYASVNALQEYVGTPYQQRYPNFFSTDARFSKDLKITPDHSIRLSVSTFNLTDHFNPEAVHMNIADPAYGSYIGQRGRRYTFDFDFLF